MLQPSRKIWVSTYIRHNWFVLIIILNTEKKGGQQKILERGGIELPDGSLGAKLVRYFSLRFLDMEPLASWGGRLAIEHFAMGVGSL